MTETRVPPSLSSLITAGVARELAGVYGDQVVFPQRVIVDRPQDEDRRFPGWPAPVVVLADENQGVCSWGVPLDDPRPPVLVGGDLDDDESTAVYAPDVASYIAARRWDARCMEREPLLQAQAAPLDDVSLARLRAAFQEQPGTRGWPGHTQLRFEGHGVTILLWCGPEQCDWWLSGSDEAALGAAVEWLLELSDLRVSMWSDSPSGEQLLDRLRCATQSR